MLYISIMKNKFFIVHFLTYFCMKKPLDKLAKQSLATTLLKIQHLLDSVQLLKWCLLAKLSKINCW